MLSRHFVFATTFVIVSAAASSTAFAGPCRPGTGSDVIGNTCIGSQALGKNTDGALNVAVGMQSLQLNSTGSQNTATGTFALQGNTTGEGNTAIGMSALGINKTGSFNTASGVSVLNSNTTRSENTASGVYTLSYNTTGNNNVAFGNSALAYNKTGNNNIALGYQAGLNLTTGNNNIVIGNFGVAADANTIRIGTQNTQTRTLVAGIRGINVTGGQSVVVNANGQLGVVSSSRRYKDDILPMGDKSDALMQLRPVTFHYKQAEADGSKPLQFGLIAEEVNEVMPDLVVYNQDGAPESVAYHLLPSLLLNEYQKQNRELVATKAKLEAIEAEFAALKLTVSRLAAATAPASVQVAAAQ